MSTHMEEWLKVRKAPKIERISVSLPYDLCKWVRETAKKNGVPVSTLVEYAIRDYRGDFTK